MNDRISEASTAVRSESDLFLIGEAAEIVRTTRQCLRHWEARGLLRPSVAAPPRKRWGKVGRPPGVVDRLYGRDDLLVAIIIRRLREEGISLQRIRRAVHALRARFGEDPLKQAITGRFRLLIGRSVFAVEDDQRRAWDLLNSEQGVAMFALAPEAKTLERLIAEWRRTKVQEQRRAEALMLAGLHGRQVRRREALETVVRESPPGRTRREVRIAVRGL